MIQLQRTAEPDASFVILPEGPIAKSPLLVENALFRILSNSRLKHIPGFRLGRGIHHFEIHGSETAVLRLGIIHSDVQNIIAAGLLVERELLAGYQGACRVELFPVAFILDLGGAAMSSQRAEGVFHVQFFLSILSRI